MLDKTPRQWAEHLLDNIATATQRRDLLTGDPTEDKGLTEAILDNADHLFALARRDGGEGEEHTVGAAWACKIGTREGVGVPRGADAPMRNAIEKAFRDVTGVDAEFCFSGWSATLTEPEMAVVENRLPAHPAPANAVMGEPG
jgi:hypothetical protein